MKATDILMDEHRVIERFLGTMERAVRRLENGQVVPPAFLLQAADFIQGFADGCHHQKEEGVLFKAMEKAGLSSQSGPVAVMLAEHELGRTYTRGMREAALAMEAGDTKAWELAAEYARSYVNLLRQHIAKEDQILFPLAGRVIPLESQAQLTDDFEHIEHEETGEGVHERFLALAQALEDQMMR